MSAHLSVAYCRTSSAPTSPDSSGSAELEHNWFISWRWGSLKVFQLAIQWLCTVRTEKSPQLPQFLIYNGFSIVLACLLFFSGIAVLTFGTLWIVWGFDSWRDRMIDSAVCIYLLTYIAKNISTHWTMFRLIDQQGVSLKIVRCLSCFLKILRRERPY